MPASQAKTMLLTGPLRAAAPAPATPAPVRAPATDDFLPFMASMEAVAADRSPSSSPFSMRSRMAATMKLAAAPRTTERMTPTKLSGAVCESTAMIDPGAAGARRPEPKTMLVAICVAPPAIIARMSFGLART